MAKTCIGLGSSMSLSMYCLSCGNDETTIPIACTSYTDRLRSVVFLLLRFGVPCPCNTVHTRYSVHLHPRSNTNNILAA